MNRTVISGNTYDEERALYGARDTLVQNCVFAGPGDGESALKESRNVEVRDCRFSLRYPLWHSDGFLLEGSSLDELTRAPIWYAKNGRVVSSEILGVKCLRECENVTFENVRAVSSEFGWRCRNVCARNCEIDSEYFLFETSGGELDGLRFRGKYSFQYTRGLTVQNSFLDTKDAFWHAEDITVKNCTVKGEYLAWYSENVTFIDCHIVGTQPLCYCRGLKLINCTMESTDLAFEYSQVDADIRGHVDSVKNPLSGRIVADSIGEIILRDSVMETDCEISLR